MPSSKFVVSSKIPSSFRAEKVKGMFDVALEEVRKEFDVSIPIETINWNVGLIVGASGSGKTTIAKNVFKDFDLFRGFEWHGDTLLDDFAENLSAKQITEALSKVGFASPPDWLKPFSVLSNGQKMRAELARLILESDKPVIYDEFTSVVDRTVAKVGSAAIQKFVRKENKKFIAVSCHYDIKEWLEPDWVYDVNTHEFSRGLLRRPEIECKIYSVSHKAWRFFKDHHYMTADINKASRCYMLVIDDSPAAFCAVLPFPHPKVKNVWKEHRTVVVPDFQGIGLGNILSEKIGSLLNIERKSFISTTSHPAMIAYRRKSKKWIMTRKPSRVASVGKTTSIGWSSSSLRLTASFKYIGG